MASYKQRKIFGERQKSNKEAKSGMYSELFKKNLIIIISGKLQLTTRLPRTDSGQQRPESNPLEQFVQFTGRRRSKSDE